MQGQISQDQMQNVKQKTQYLNAEIRKDLRDLTLTLKFSPKIEDQVVFAAATSLIEQLAKQMGEQLSIFFGIRGKIVNIKHAPKRFKEVEEEAEVEDE